MGLFSKGEKAHSDGASSLWEGPPSNISKADWRKLQDQAYAANPALTNIFSPESIRQAKLGAKIHDAAERGEN